MLAEATMETGGKDFTRDLVSGSIANLNGIDRLIKELAPAWPVEQIPMVDRNILRIAIYEMRYKHSAPPKVVINEAVELAKTDWRDLLSWAGFADDTTAHKHWFPDSEAPPG